MWAATPIQSQTHLKHGLVLGYEPRVVRSELDDCIY